MRASPPSSSPCLHGHGGKVACAVAACLALVTFLVVALDPRTGASSWFLSSSSSFLSSLRPTARGGSNGGAAPLFATSSYAAAGGKNSSVKAVLFRQQDAAGGHPAVASVVSVGDPPPHVSVAPAPESGFDDAASPGGTVEVRVPLMQGRVDVKLEKVELGLAKARLVIREAIRNKDKRPPLTDRDYVPVGPVYRNAYAFHRSYLEMEKLFKVYVYEEGEPPVFHDGPCRSIYSSEGRFIFAMEMENRMRTRDPELAHVFFLPFSVVKMVKMIYEPNSHDMEPLRRTLSDYIDVLSTKYPYWNRSLGADHFMLSCHDWGPYVSSADGHLFSNSIRVLCNANTSEGFNPSKDVSLPEINLRTDIIADQVGGPSASHRPILAFFAGGDHGPVRPLLLQHWKGKDADVQVSEYLPRGVSYINVMRRSKFCLCPSGYEVASPRVVEAIYLECVPVVIGDDYVLPFSDVLNWPAFSVRVAVADIPNLKTILAAVSPRQYIRMQRRVRTVRRHFMVNGPPRRFDVFHMILHSIWLRRLNVRLHAQDS
ncbi:probable glycosyltransferase At5g03795 [Triticum dicoccoides]|uniref:Exostosin GT47 domain-containing protein n=1 Tax=Triticum turgidum subsp. durum TaxID=4567 RepID=A0A9R0TFI3_TRITD|nr:probable glycosyltransferase At5g03795 [Triticum dicoccoides]VAI12773.1 unnamed protein product [Triticum turgidum subsp. durum]